METQDSVRPLLSIITINRNNADGLARTIESVRCQTSGNFEHIIIDGASTDKSVQVIKDFLKDDAYKNKVSYWHSRSDGGVYDAMNQGIPHANGSYCLFLNSGDFLFDVETVAKIEALVSEHDDDIFYGRSFCFTRDYERIVDYPKTLNLGYLYRKSINHQNCLIKTSLQKENLYSLDYAILADREFFVRVFLSNPTLSCRYIDFIIARYEEEHGLSSDNPERVLAEEKRLQDTAFPKILSDSFLFFEEKERSVQERLDAYEKKYHGVLKSMKSLLEKYSAAKARFFR